MNIIQSFSIKEKKGRLSYNKKKKEGLLTSFGAWKDRKDIKDSASWVAKMRKQWSKRNAK